jgi:hypothetical protein
MRLPIFLALMTAAACLRAAPFEDELNGGAASAAATAAQARAERSVEGSYGEAIANGDEVLVSGLLTIERRGEGAVFFSVERQSHEGGRASCTLSGVAKKEGDRYVFEDSEKPLLSDKPCRLELVPNGSRVALVDHGTCQDYCGAAMTLSGAVFKK